MSAENKKAGFNVFSLLEIAKPFFGLIKKYWYVPLIAGLLFGGFGYYKEKQIQPTFSAQITYILEDEILSGGQAVQNPLMAAITGQAPTNNKVIMNDLAWSNKLLEYTLLSGVNFNGRLIKLANMYQISLGYMSEKDTVNKFWIKDDYTLGQDIDIDFRLRSLSNMIKLNFKATVLESGLLKLTYSSNHEKFTKLFLEQHLKTISDFYTEKRLERAKLLVRLTTRKRDSLLALIQGKEYSMAASQDFGIGTVMQRAQVPQVQIKRDITILSAQYGESVGALNAAKMELEKNRPFISVVDDIRFPLDAVWPKPLNKAITFSIIGLFVGIAGIIGINLGLDFLKQQKVEFQKKTDAPF